MKKIKVLQKKLESKAAFLVSNKTNIEYLSGFSGASETERESMLLVTKKAAYLIIPKLYATSIKSNSHFKVVVSHGYLETIIELVDKNTNSLEFEKADLKYFEFEGLKVKLKSAKLDIKLNGTASIIEQMRAVKSKQEIDLIRRAQELTELTLKAAVEALEGGMFQQYTEISLADEIRRIGMKLGGEALGFETIVALNEAAAQPHYFPQQKPLKPNSVLLIDLGIKYKGYSGDLTRTFYIGEPSVQFRKNYNFVLECNKYILELLKSQKDFSEIHKAAVEFFKKYDLHEKFIHSIGHGLGLEVHEEPFARKDKVVNLVAGNLITIEPGLYFKNKYGIRIEDMVLIKEKGFEILNKDTFKELYTIN